MNLVNLGGKLVAVETFVVVDAWMEGISTEDKVRTAYRSDADAGAIAVVLVTGHLEEVR